MNFAIPVQRSNQLSYQAKLVTCEFVLYYELTSDQAKGKHSLFYLCMLMRALSQCVDPT